MVGIKHNEDASMTSHKPPHLMTIQERREEIGSIFRTACHRLKKQCQNSTLSEYLTGLNAPAERSWEPLENGENP